MNAAEILWSTKVAFIELPMSFEKLFAKECVIIQRDDRFLVLYERVQLLVTV